MEKLCELQGYRNNVWSEKLCTHKEKLKNGMVTSQLGMGINLRKFMELSVSGSESYIMWVVEH